MRNTPFTLIEILSAIAIIALLAALLIGGAGFASRASAEAKTRSLLKQMELALEQYFQDRGYYPTETASGTVDWNRAGFMSTTGVAYLENYNYDTANPFEDAWDRPFYYENDSVEGYHLWSKGYDGEHGRKDDGTPNPISRAGEAGSDDITSWTRSD
jgi:type II secretory pathway pseudopilin PulG